MIDEPIKPVRTLAFFESMYDQYVLMLLSKIIDKTISNSERDSVESLMKEVGIRAVNEPGTPTAKLLQSISTVPEDPQEQPFIPFPVKRISTAN